MHDLDGEFEEEAEEEFEDEFEDEFEEEFEGEFEFAGESGYFGESEMENPFNEAEEMELAAELLSVSDEAELEQFLGKLFRRVGRKVGRFMRSRVGRKIGGFLKGLARKALPIAGGVVGTVFGGPAGGMIGSSLGSAASRIFGRELEALGPEEQELEVAKRFVRLAGTAVKKAALAPPTGNPNIVAKKALMAAARSHAPGLLKSMSGKTIHEISGPRRSGRWIRRGRKIILTGI